jgi:hypothetical protein
LISFYLSSPGLPIPKLMVDEKATNLTARESLLPRLKFPALGPKLAKNSQAGGTSARIL